MAKVKLDPVVPVAVDDVAPLINAICLIPDFKPVPHDVGEQRESYLEGLANDYCFFAKRFAQIFIVTAKHGLIPPDDERAGTGESVNDLSASQREVWVQQVRRDLNRVRRPGQKIVCLLASNTLRLLRRTGVEMLTPLAGMSVRMRSDWLRAHKSGDLGDVGLPMDAGLDVRRAGDEVLQSSRP